jgi:type III secretion protein S
MNFELSLVNYLMSGLWSAAILSGPPLLAATATGIIIALIQTLIQLQEQTLPVAVKLITVAVILMAIGFKLTMPLYSLSERIFSDFSVIAK